MHSPTPSLSQDDRFFSSIPVGYVAVRSDGVITQVNAALAKALDYTPADLVGRLAMEFPFDDANRRLYQEQATRRSQGATGSYALQLRGHMNKRVTVACFAVPQYTEAGEFWGSRGIIVPYVQVGQLAKAFAVAGAEGWREVVDSIGGPVPAAPEAWLGAAQSRAASFAPLGGDGGLLQVLLPSLTRRERDVVALLLTGLRVQGIAERLQLSHYTVRNHLKRIFRKAGVNSQGQLLMRLNGVSS